MNDSANQLLLACLHDPLREPEQITAILQRFADDSAFWQRLHALSLLFGIKHVLHAQVKAAGAKSLLPTWIADDWEADYFKNAARNTVLLGDLREVLNAFAVAKIDCMPLKGSVLLLENVYENPGLRTLSDIDIMVREKDLTASDKLLEELGYRSAPGMTLSHAQYREQKNHLHPRLSPRNIPLELHWCFEPYRRGAAHDTSRLWDKSRVTSEGWRLPSNEDQLLHLAIHLVKADLFSFPSFIKICLDWQALEKKFPAFDETYLNAEMARRGLQDEWNWSLQAMKAARFLPRTQVFLPRPLVRMERTLSHYLLREAPEHTHETALKISLGKERYLHRRVAMLLRVFWPSQDYVDERGGRVAHLKSLSRRVWPKRLLGLLNNRREWLWAVESVRTLLLLPFYQRFVPLDVMLKRLDASKAKNGLPSSNDVSRMSEIAEWFLGLGWGPFRPTCLKRTLLLFHLFRREGMQAVVHLGVRKTGEHLLDGHAWVSLNGKAFTDSGSGAFVQTYQYPN